MKYTPKFWYKIYRIKMDYSTNAEFVDIVYRDYDKAYSYCCKKNSRPIDKSDPDSFYYYFYIKEFN